MENVKVTYALRVKRTGELVRILKSSNEGGDCCGEYRHEWVAGAAWADLPVYEVEKPQTLARALSRDTPWFNADYNSPMHGSVDPQALEIVKRTVTEVLEPLDIEIPPVVRCLDSLAKPMNILRRYAGVSELPELARTLRIFELPEGETVESMKRFEGKDVESTAYSSFRLFAVFSVPEDYQDLLKGKPGFAAATALTWDVENN